MATTTRDTVLAMYDAAVRGDMAAFFDTIADDLVLREPEFLPYGGRWDGKQGMQEMFGQAAAILDIPTLKVDSLISQGDRAMAVLTIDRVGSAETFVIAEESIVRNGKVSEIRIFVHEAGSLVKSAVE